MARGRTRRSAEYGDFWPGYVDVLSTLLLVVIFLMSIFMLAQYFASEEASGKDTALKRLTRQISELTSLLSLEKGKTKSAEDELSALQASLSTLKEENTKLSGFALSGDEQAKAAQARISGLESDLEGQKKISNEALAKVDILNQQLLSLRRQIAALNEALEASEKKDAESQTRIKDLGARLNAALARQVQELQRYRSDFFGRLRELLKNRKDIKIVGDRFVFESEVLFPSGSATLTPEGFAAMDQLASAIIELERQIPKEINWALQVDGHTDIRPIASPTFPSNWDLSTARAISVVRYLISRGVDPTRLVAAGYGEFRPLTTGTDEASLQQNRRIELKLTNR
ncbi:MAG TPA: peptidoglycan -binding protein [Hyphomicrobium sp.]|jgi:chemotaxis protein MotB